MGISEEGEVVEHSATVEEMPGNNWNVNYKMSPVFGLDKLARFSAISLGRNLFIFGAFNFIKTDNHIILRRYSRPIGIQFVRSEVGWCILGDSG